MFVDLIHEEGHVFDLGNVGDQVLVVLQQGQVLVFPGLHIFYYGVQVAVQVALQQLRVIVKHITKLYALFNIIIYILSIQSQSCTSQAGMHALVEIQADGQDLSSWGE